MSEARGEVFGPVVALLAIEGLDEAIAVANDSPYGLTAGIITNDLRAATRFAREVQAGIVKVNLPTTGFELHVPCGGLKGSSTATLGEQGANARTSSPSSAGSYLGA
jgi:acyl-CoA reductase-like NAD-dependent aldehyde dehydrogenase